MNPSLSHAFDPKGEPRPNGQWTLKLFVVGESAASARAVTNLKKLAATHLPAATQIQIIDLAREPDAEGAQDVIALPLLVRKYPPPPRRIIGDLADTARVLEVLEIPFEK